jgi:hypothetical protein
LTAGVYGCRTGLVRTSGNRTNFPNLQQTWFWNSHDPCPCRRSWHNQLRDGRVMTCTKTKTMF